MSYFLCEFGAGARRQASAAMLRSRAMRDWRKGRATDLFAHRDVASKKGIFSGVRKYQAKVKL